MLELLRPVAEHHARKVAAVFSSMSGMMAVAVLVGDPRTGTVEPKDYLYASIIFTMTLAAGALTVWVAREKTLRWTIIEMAAFFVAGIIAMIVMARFL